MNLARHIEELFVGKDQRAEKDLAIARERAEMINNVQAVRSGARLVEHMSGMLRLMVEENHAK